MNEALKTAAIKGYERVCAWADLLDEINVFPVADGDTGSNLKISLSPVKTMNLNGGRITENILKGATGNAGNIAAAFFSEMFIAGSVHDISYAVKKGREKAWASIAEPKEGTMLTFFDSLDIQMRSMMDGHDLDQHLQPLLKTLEETVRSTSQTLPELRAAQVVDAGALGMFIFFEGFLKSLSENHNDYLPIARVFGDRLKVTGKTVHSESAGYCVNATLSPESATRETTGEIRSLGKSVVTVQGSEDIRIHLHTEDADGIREKLSGLGTVKGWRAEKMSASGIKQTASENGGTVHIMTDAAGSITREDATALGVTLLDSYLVIGGIPYPETLYDAKKLYQSMKNGSRVSTAQASLFERCQSYNSVTERFDQTLYLTVGSFYTGNYNVAQQWRQERCLEEKIHILDTGAASGRLSLIVETAARFSALNPSLNAVISHTQKAMETCDELIFLDQLRYLAAGGRISKTRGFFGDLLHLKPVIRPGAGGAEKVAVVRKTKDQLPFALNYLKKKLPQTASALILLEYSDNRERVEHEIKDVIVDRYPEAIIKVKPLSMTSGAHMGPGTWGIAFCPEIPVL